MTIISSQRSRGVEPIRWRYPYDPSQNPKQMTFHLAKAKEKLYGGAAGGGKTAAMLAELVALVLSFGVTCLILRQMTTALGEISRRLQDTIPPEVGTWNEQKKTWHFRNGGRLMLGYLEHDKDVNRYAGNEYFCIAWDELTQFTEWQYLRMLHPLRIATSHPGWPAIEAAGLEPYYIAGTNPGSRGHQWVRERFIDPAPPGVLWRPKSTENDPNPGSRIFVPSRVQDNPFLGESYMDQLRAMGEDEQRMLILGDWDVYSGQMFAEFRRDIHVVDPDRIPLSLGGVARSMGVDYGLSNPFCALWGAMLPDDVLYVYRERYGADHLAPEQARMILEAEQVGERLPNRQIPVNLDPACWARSPTSPKPLTPNAPPPDSVAWHYAQAGLPIRKALNDRLIGLAEVKRRLKVRADGLPSLLISSDCVDLIRTLPTLLRDPNNPEDVDTKMEDHAYDALRYLCMAHRSIRPEEQKIESPRKRDQRLAEAVGGWRNKPS